jgi:hypothetical protein
MNMPDLIEQLDSWLHELEGKHPVEWGVLPDIGLYMDQVQTYIDRQLMLYHRDDHERLLTPAMINNYIKDNLIPRADVKKYTPVHLALLIMIGTLKQVLSIPNLNRLLSGYRESSEVADLYNRFNEVQHASLKENASQVLAEIKALAAASAVAEATSRPPAVLAGLAAGESATGTETENCAATEEDTAAALRNLALQLSIEARTRILIAEKIIALLAAPKPPKPEEPARRAAPVKG